MPVRRDDVDADRDVDVGAERVELARRLRAPPAMSGQAAAARDNFSAQPARRAQNVASCAGIRPSRAVHELQRELQVAR